MCSHTWVFGLIGFCYGDSEFFSYAHDRSFCPAYKYQLSPNILKLCSRCGDLSYTTRYYKNVAAADIPLMSPAFFIAAGCAAAALVLMLFLKKKEQKKRRYKKKIVLRGVRSWALRFL